MNTSVPNYRNEKYPRNRPFLTITFIRRPEKGVNTSKFGWMEVTGNVNTFEQPILVDRINATHMIKANVIIDVLNGKCVKNYFEKTPDDEVVTYFLEKYRDQVKEAMDVWLSQAAGKVASTKSVDAVYSAV